MDMELARAYNNLADPGEPEGRTLLHRALELMQPHEEELRDTYSWNFRMGYAYFYMDQEGKALPYFEKALEFSTSKEIEYTLIGMVYYLEDRLDEAVENFNLAIDENDSYTKAYEGRNQAMLENHVKILDLQEALKKYF